MNLLHRLSLLILALLLAPLPLSAGEIIEGKFHSAATDAEQPYRLYVPKGATPEARVPSLYILHGAYGNYTDWTEKTDVEELADRYQMILVFPDGGQFGWYVDSPLEPHSKYETMVARELVAEVDAKYPTIAKPEARGIMGLSMGGHGALSLALKHRDVFGSASSLSGILRLENHPTQWEIPNRLGPLDANEPLWLANSVYTLVDSLKDRPMPILFDCGRDDKAAYQDNVELDAKLVELGIPHIWRPLAGAHSWEYWGANLQSHLNFHQAQVIAQLPEAEKWFGFNYKREKIFLDENASLVVDAPTSPTIVIAGSSSAQGFKSALLPEWRVFNRGIAADRVGLSSRGLSQRMEESFFDMNPDVVVLKIGRNDLSAAQTGNGTPTLEAMVAHYEGMVQQVRERLPNATLLITGAFPVRGKYARLRDPILPWNEQLRLIAARNGATYLDVHTSLLDAEGYAAAEFTSDGLHLSAKGYAKWAEAIRGALTNP
jgi:S-formylglutathione hydrolase FrmB/lysophospholipase L1-like esterase